MNRSKFQLNITNKFIAYLMIISIFPLLFVGMLSYRISYNILQSEANRYAQALVQNQLDYLDLQLEQIESLIANVSNVEEITTALEDSANNNDTYVNLVTRARIGYILNGYSNLRGLVSIDIFTMGGAHYHVGDTLDVSNIRRPVLDQLFDKATTSEQLIYWSGIEENVNANSSYEQVITATKLISRINRETLQQETVALILVNYSVDDLYEHFHDIDLGEGAYLMVVDNENRIIFHPDKQRLGQVATPELVTYLEQPRSREVITLNGQEISISYARSERNQWTVLSLIPVSTLTSKTAVIGAGTFWALVASFLIVGLAAWFYSREVVYPIRAVTQRFQQLEAGSLDQEKRLEPTSNDEIGELVNWFNVFMDSLAARREAEAQIEASLKEKEILLQEIHHRVKNNLQIISSLLNLQSAHVSDPATQAVFEDSKNRIRSMALIHEKLYQSQNLSQIDFGEYVENLVAYLARSYHSMTQPVQVIVEAVPVYLDIDTAVPCALLLNELISNAYKHAFINQPDGQINVQLTQDETNRIKLSVQDNGVGIPADILDNQPDTLGLQLVETLTNQLHGTLMVEVESGTIFTILFPA